MNQDTKTRLAEIKETKFLTFTSSHADILWLIDQLEQALAKQSKYEVTLDKLLRGATEMSEYFALAPKEKDGHENPIAHTAYVNFGIVAELCEKALESSAQGKKNE